MNLRIEHPLPAAARWRKDAVIDTRHNGDVGAA